MGSKCCKNNTSPEDQSRLLRRDLSTADQYRASNNNLYPLRISEIRPVDRSNQLYTFVPPTTPPRHSKSGTLNSNASKDGRMTLSTETSKPGADNAAGGSSGGPPILLRQLNDGSIKIGGKARLLVEVEPNYGSGSNGAVKVTWFRNDVKITNPLISTSSSGGDSQPRFTPGNEGRFYFLDISEVHLEDEGKWICLVENFYGRSSSTCNIKVQVPKAYKAPEFVEGLKAILTEAGTVSLECKVIGVPVPTLTWFKDGKLIQAGDVFALKGDPSSLGVYTVHAQNCLGSVTSSSKVHMSGLGTFDENRLTIVQNIPNCRVRVGDKYEFQFKSSRPLSSKDTVEWYNKNSRVEEKDRLIFSTEGNVCKLFFNQVEVQDDGEWICEITSEGHKVSTSCTMSLLIPRNYRKPRFLENLKAILTEEGLVSFECKVSGYPTPVLQWYKDNYELKPGDVYQLSGANSLGKYSCVAKNCMGYSESSTELTLEDIQHQLSDEERQQLLTDKATRPPKFLKGLQALETKIGEACQLQVHVNDPKAAVAWFRDGVPVNGDDEKYFFKNEGGLHTLNISTLEFEDQAEWKCACSNDYGHSFTSSRIKLIIPSHYKKPKFLESLRAILSEEGTVNLECKVIGVPVPILKWYKDGVELKAGDIHRIISGADGTCCLGTYCCEARNCMGTASSSAALLGFEDKMLSQKQASESQRNTNNLTRDPSLSTILEERTSQMLSTCETPMAQHNKSMEEDIREEVSLSIDGKEVSVSLYETPDLTENDAKQIIEMFADEYSEYISEHNIVPLPSLRFMKETSTSGNIVMEAVVIDVTDDPFESAKSMSLAQVREDPTEGDVEDISDSFESPMDLSGDYGGDLERRHSARISRSRQSSSKRSKTKPGKPRSGSEQSLQGSEEVFLSAESERTLSQKYADVQETMQSLHEADTLYSSAEESNKHAVERSVSNGEKKVALTERKGAQDDIDLIEESLKALSSHATPSSTLAQSAMASQQQALVCQENQHLTQLEAFQDDNKLPSETQCDITYQQFQAVEGENKQLLETIQPMPRDVHVLEQVGEGTCPILHPVGQEYHEPLSQIQSLGADDHSFYDGHETIHGSERFIGIEMAEMVLEGADTFSDLDSLSGVYDREAMEVMESDQYEPYVQEENQYAVITEDGIKQMETLEQAYQEYIASQQAFLAEEAKKMDESVSSSHAKVMEPGTTVSSSSEPSKKVQQDKNNATQEDKLSPVKVVKVTSESSEPATQSKGEAEERSQKHARPGEENISVDDKKMTAKERKLSTEEIKKVEDGKKAESKATEESIEVKSHDLEKKDKGKKAEADGSEEADEQTVQVKMVAQDKTMTPEQVSRKTEPGQELGKKGTEEEKKAEAEKAKKEMQKAEEDKSNQAEVEKAKKADEEKSKRAEEEKPKQDKSKLAAVDKDEEEKLKQAGEDKAKETEGEKANRAEDDKTKQTEKAKKIDEEKSTRADDGKAKQAEEEKAKKKDEEENEAEEMKAKKAKQEEAKKADKEKTKTAELEKKKAEEEKAKKVEEEKEKKVEEEKAKKAEEVKAKKVKEEKATKAEEENAKQAEEEKAKKAAEEKAKKAEEEKAKKPEEDKGQKTEEEKAKKADEEKKKAEEEKAELEKKKAEEEKAEKAEQEKAKKAEEEKAKKAEEQKAKKPEEEKAKKAEEEKAKKAEEEKAKKAEEEKKKAEEEKAKKAEEEKVKKAEEEKKKAEEEKAKKAEEEKAKKAEEEKTKKAEGEKKKAEEEKAKQAEEEKAKKAEEEKAKKAEEEKAKKAEEEKAKKAEEKKAKKAEEEKAKKAEEEKAKKPEEEKAKKAEEEKGKKTEEEKAKKAEEEKAKKAEGEKAKKAEEEKKKAEEEKVKKAEEEKTKKAEIAKKKAEEEKAKKAEEEKANKAEEEKAKKAEVEKAKKAEEEKAKKAELDKKKAEEEKAKKAEEENVKKAEEEKKKAEEEKAKKAEEEKAKKAEEEKTKKAEGEKKKAEEEKAKQAEEEKAKKAEEEKAKKAELEKKKAEEEKAKKAEEEKAKKAEEEKAKKAEEEKAKKAELEKKKAEEEKAKKAEEEKAKKAEEEKAKKAEEEKAKKAEEEKVKKAEIEKKKAEEEKAKKAEEEKAKKAEEEKTKKAEIEKKKAEEEKATQDEEEKAKKAEEEKAKKAEEEKVKKAEIEKKKAEEEKAKKAEEEKTKKAEEEKTKKAEEEKAKKAEEEKAKKAEEEKAKKAEEEKAKKAEEEKAKKAEEEKAKKAEEEKAKKAEIEKKKAEEEKAKKAEEEKAKKAEEEKAKKAELEKKKAEEEKAKKAEEEKAKKAEEEKVKKAEEERAKKAELEKKKAEEEKAKKVEEEKSKKDEEEKVKKPEEEKKKAEEEKAKKAEEKKAEEEKAKKAEVEKAEEEKARKAEEEKAKKVEEEKKKADEEKTKKEEEEKARKAAEEKAKKAEDEKAKKAAEEKAKKAEIGKEKTEEEKAKKAEDEKAKKAEEEEAKKAELEKKKAEEEKNKKAEGEKAKKAEEAKSKNSEIEKKKAEEAEIQKKNAEEENAKKAEDVKPKNGKEENSKQAEEAKLEKKKAEAEEVEKTKGRKTETEKDKAVAEQTVEGGKDRMAEKDEGKTKTKEAGKEADAKQGDERRRSLENRAGNGAPAADDKLKAQERKKSKNGIEIVDESQDKVKPALEKRPSLDEPLKISGVKKVKKIEVQSLQLSEENQSNETILQEIVKPLAVEQETEECIKPTGKSVAHKEKGSDEQQGDSDKIKETNEGKPTRKGSKEVSPSDEISTEQKRKSSVKQKDGVKTPEEKGAEPSLQKSEKESILPAAGESAAPETTTKKRKSLKEKPSQLSPSTTKVVSDKEEKIVNLKGQLASSPPESPSCLKQDAQPNQKLNEKTRSAEAAIEEPTARQGTLKEVVDYAPKSIHTDYDAEDRKEHRHVKYDDDTRKPRSLARSVEDESHYGKLHQRSRSYDHIAASSQAMTEDNIRGLVVVGGDAYHKGSHLGATGPDRMESLGYFSYGSRRNLLDESKYQSSLPHPDYTPQHVRHRPHSHHHFHNLRDEDSLAELDELPSDRIPPPPPIVPPRMKRQQRLYQMKLSSEAEDMSPNRHYSNLYGSHYDGQAIPSYFTVPSMGYSYFSMLSLPGAGVSDSMEHLDEISRRRRPRFSMKLQDRTTPINTGMVKFTCTVFGQPNPTIQWYKNGIPIFSDRQKYIITNTHGVCVLDIKHVDKNDEGVHVCFARNFYGKCASSAILQVVGLGDYTKGLSAAELGSCSGSGKCIPVNFTTDIMETYFPEVNELVLECQSTGHPIPQVSWMKNGEIIIGYDQTNYGRFKAEQWSLFESVKCRLIIQRPRTSDSGVYTCSVRNYDISIPGRRICNSDEITKLVTVKQNSAPGGVYAYVPPKGTVGMKTTSFEYQSPTFVSLLEDFKKVTLGDDLILTVQIIGTPSPTVRWFHHKNSTTPLQSSDRIRVIKEAGGVYTLLISQVTAYDLGTYICKLNNKYGSAESSCSVSEFIPGLMDKDMKQTGSYERAQRAPIFVREPPEMFCLRCGDDFVFDCIVEGFPQPSVNLYRGCRNVTLRPRAYKEIVPQVSTPEDRQHVRFTLSRLQCTDFGMYRVEVKNICGMKELFVNLKMRDRAHSMTPSPSTCPARQWTGSLSRLDKPYFSHHHQRTPTPSRYRSSSSLSYSSTDY